MSYLIQLVRETIQSQKYELPATGIPLASLYNATMNIWFPLVWVAGYLYLTGKHNAKRPCANKITGNTAKALVLLHNVLLAVFSMWTFYNVAPPVFNRYIKVWRLASWKGCKHVLCDSDDYLWNNVIFKYGYLFYLSKPYECLDTLIILLKGKKVKPLQSFHHAGAIIAMYAGVRLQSVPILFFVLFNSFIHSIMYTYYICSIVHLPFPRFLKQSLTTLQILQFIVGASVAISFLFIELDLVDLDSKDGLLLEAGRCMQRSSPQAFAVLLNVAYLIPLTALFGRFYFISYFKRAAPKKVD